MAKKSQFSNYRRIVSGTALLSISSLIAKILSAVYRVPFQNLVGNVGFYTYQQVYPLYGIAVTISLTGMPVFISQVVAEESDRESQRAVARQLTLCLWLVGMLACAGLIAFAPAISRAMGDHSLAGVIDGIAPVYALAPLVAGARGFRQGRLELVPTAASQLGEQTVRVVLVIVVAVVAASGHWNVYLMGQRAMLASVVGSLTAIIILLPTLRHLARPSNIKLDKRRLWRRLWTGGGLLCLLAALMVLLQLVDAFTIKRALVASGLSQGSAKSLKGVFDRAQPLVQLGLVIANSFVALLMPSLTQAQTQGDQRGYWRLYRMMVHFCLLISVLATGGLVALMPQINQLLFKTRAGSAALSVEMVAIVFAAIVNCNASILQTRRRGKQLGFAIIAGLAVKLVLNYWLVIQWQIMGAAVATVIALVVMTAITQLAMPREEHVVGISFGCKLTFITILMMIVAKGLATLVEQLTGTGRLAEILVVFLAVLAGLITAAGLTLLTHLLTKEELAMLPGNSRWLRGGKE